MPMTTHFYKYCWDNAEKCYYVDRELSQAQFEQSYLQYWNRTRKELNR